MITKSVHRFRFSHACLRSEGLGQKRRGHGGNVLMREANVGNSKQGITGLHRINADLSGSNESMMRDDLFDDVHRAALVWPTRYRRWFGQLRWRNLTRQARFVVIEQPAIFD